MCHMLFQRLSEGSWLCHLPSQAGIKNYISSASESACFLWWFLSHSASAHCVLAAPSNVPDGTVQHLVCLCSWEELRCISSSEQGQHQPGLCSLLLKLVTFQVPLLSCSDHIHALHSKVNLSFMRRQRCSAWISPSHRLKAWWPVTLTALPGGEHSRVVL